RITGRIKMAIPWIPLLTLGTQLLGGIMGNQTSTTANQNSTTTGVTGTTSGLESDTTQNKTDQVSRLDDTTKNQLTTTVQKLLADAGKGSSALQVELDRLTANPSTFDPNDFVEGLMSSARAKSTFDTQSTVGALGSRAGVNSG